MNTSVEWTGLCLIVLGFFLFGGSILFRLGRFRASYWFNPFSYYRTASYGTIPADLVMVLLGIGLLFFLDKPLFDTIWVVILRVLIAFLFLLSLFMWLFEPSFAKPDWINWLEDNHSDILPELRRELWRMGPGRKEVIEDQAKLEAWIEEFRHSRMQ